MTHTPTPAEQLLQARRLAAEAEFENYDFGEVGFQTCSGWESTGDAAEMTRPCYITDDDDEEGPSLKVTFTVRFAPGRAEVAEAYVMHKGDILGKRGAPAEKLAPAVQVRERSSRPDVRNPMLALPEVREQFAALPVEAREALVIMLRAITKSCRANAETAYRKHKPPMYAYWKAMGVNARHLALAGAKASPRADQRSAAATIAQPTTARQP